MSCFPWGVEVDKCYDGVEPVDFIVSKQNIRTGFKFNLSALSRQLFSRVNIKF